MSLGEIFSNSIRYPFGDITKFLIVGILAMLVSLSQLIQYYGFDNAGVLAIGGIISLLLAILLAGYSVSVIKRGINHSDEIPDIDPKKNFIDGLKSFVISIVYLIIPFLIMMVIGFVTGVIGASINQFTPAMAIIAVVGIILFLVFGLLEMVAISRFASSGVWGDALSLGAVWNDAKSIGIFKIIAFLIVVLIIAVIASLIAGLLAVIPYVGLLIGQILVGGFSVLFFGKAIGLLYSEA